MAAASSKISVGVSCNMCLTFSDRLDRNVCFFYEFIKLPDRNWIAARIDDNSGLNKADSAYAPVYRVCDHVSIGRRIWFITKYGNDRGGIDNHFGSPRSS